MRIAKMQANVERKPEGEQKDNKEWKGLESVSNEVEKAALKINNAHQQYSYDIDSLLEYVTEMHQQFINSKGIGLQFGR